MLVCCVVLLPHGTRGRLWEALAAALLTSTVSFLVPMMVACQVKAVSGMCCFILLPINMELLLSARLKQAV